MRPPLEDDQDAQHQGQAAGRLLVVDDLKPAPGAREVSPTTAHATM